MTVAAALTSGTLWLLRKAPRIQSGSVVVSAPARKNVTAISSKDSANDSSAPATSAVRIVGRVTWRKVWKPLAPRSREASSSEGDTLRSRASTLLNTSTMQNVVCPMITVRIERSVFVNRKNEASATPVITPGRMIGSVTAKLISSLAEEPEASEGERHARAQQRGRTRSRTVAILTDSQAASLGPRVVEELVEPARREARERPRVDVRLVERVEDDQGQRQVEECEHERAGAAEDDLLGA